MEPPRMVDRREYPARPEVVVEIRRFLRDVATRASFGRYVDDLVLAASEACANVIRHSGSRNLAVTWASEPGHAEVLVEDTGVFGRGPVAEEHLPSRGFGIPLMQAVAHELHIERGTPDEPGTTVRIVVRKGPNGSR